MAKKYGKCTNIGNCDNADQKKVIEVVDGQDFACPECGSQLYQIDGATTPKTPLRKILGIGIPILLVLSALLYFVSKSTTTTPPASIIETGHEKGTGVPAKCDLPDILFELEAGRRPMVVGVEFQAPPMSYANPESKEGVGINSYYTGFAVDYAKKIAQILHFNKEVKVVVDTFNLLPTRINNKEADIVIAGYPKDPSIPNILWSDPFLTTGYCLIVKEGSPYSNVDQLKGKKIGIFSGDNTIKNWVSSNVSNAIIDDTHSETGWFKSLDDGKWDAIIYDLVYANKEIANFPHLRIVQLNLLPSEYSIMIPCNNSKLLYKVNEAIATIHSSDYQDYLENQYIKINKSSVKLTFDNNCTNCITVMKNETLGKISKRTLGNSQRYMEIFRLNKDRLASPHLIPVGIKLKIPSR
jgi:ABC-type amino acid transport substrate-binding protein